MVDVTFIVPLVVVFTKFDGQIIQEYSMLHDIQNDEDKWNTARERAENTLKTAYLAKFLNTDHPPKGYAQLEGRTPVKYILCNGK